MRRPLTPTGLGDEIQPFLGYSMYLLLSVGYSPTKVMKGRPSLVPVFMARYLEIPF